MITRENIAPRLLERYDLRGPRYTSYPPANHFHELSGERLARRWQAGQAASRDAGLGLYVHLPFCRSRCLYCACHVEIGTKQPLVEAYLSALHRELELVAGHMDLTRPVSQVVLGGGTPNFLTPEQLRRLFARIADVWSPAAEAERSVELDPRVATPKGLDAFLAAGFNRFSLGVQDLDEEVVRRVRPGGNEMAVEEVHTHLRAAGIESVNFDLIYGLPGQTPASAARTAERVIKLAPTRLALYSYAHVPWIKPHQAALERRGLPDAAQKALISREMAARFAAAGYIPIGMDHYALPNDPLVAAQENGTLRRNFMGYTTGRGLETAACGTSAISYMGRAYGQNTKHLPAYIEALEQGRLPIERGFLLDSEDHLRRELLLELFCNFTLDLQALSARFAIDAPAHFARELTALEPLLADGLVEFEFGPADPSAGAGPSDTPGQPQRLRRIIATDLGRFFIRNVCMVFDSYLEAEAATPVYSRTV